MNNRIPVYKFLFFICIFSFLCFSVKAQKVRGPATYDPAGGVGHLEIASTIANVGQIDQIFLRSKKQNISVTATAANGFNITAVPASPLQCGEKKPGVDEPPVPVASCSVVAGAGKLIVLDDYKLNIFYTDDKGNQQDVSLDVILFNQTTTVDSLSKVKADSDEDAEYYVSGNITAVRKKKTAFTTEINIQPYRKYYSGGTFALSPFFKLNASTSADADPDKMEIGLKFRTVVGNFAGFNGAFYDNDVKLESERDFDNTNLIYDTRFIFLPSSLTKGNKNLQVFINPFIGAELGKNLKSPLNAAEGDGIARVLGGADLRLAFLNAKGKPWANWTTSYTRRWLLSNELGYDTDDDNNLVLIQYGKGPREFFESKFSFAVSKFADAFIAYDWGQVPPSYKKIDHRFRIGFEFKRKTIIE